VAYSEPIEGSTFSPADSETNSANGTSQTHRPKYDAISVNEGMLASRAYGYDEYEDDGGGALKWRNQK
jgi:hypothetical protein